MQKPKFIFLIKQGGRWYVREIQADGQDYLGFFYNMRRTAHRIAVEDAIHHRLPVIYRTKVKAK